MVELRPQNPTLTGALPRDRPSAARPHRVYVALTNHCNRACPWCSTHSSPAGRSFLDLAAFRACLPAEGPFEVQLEGGEPTIHPEFWAMVELARAHPRCAKLVVVTNGVVLPRSRPALDDWLAKLGEPATLKLSVNHHLLARDRDLLALATTLREALASLGGARELVLNVRLRPDAPGRDAWVVDAVREAGLLALANVFHLQAYGMADDRDWERPFVVGSNFSLINPDGRSCGTDLIARSAAMRVLP
ncbi:radical SAM protein [Pseudenhygromyxa sp. WMMC2535]|uniref:radical SAM protein n=1 Tax=Pseudenhygromyxa sp. WMMC2535 TaxID=2712867 RepID=UPI001555ABD4|nr:radical SAM protein [Pseudenhygromyxa sp. WMMC2535]NVB43138.1 radical SAM protein [Pseudenhygromyxa sp. WMMC2535]NVB43784.1 radical SAM protein [Pseudenhygromyxa sp. WMMC2535]